MFLTIFFKNVKHGTNKQSYFLNAGPNLLALINLTLTPIFCAPGAAATVVRLADRNLIDW